MKLRTNAGVLLLWLLLSTGALADGASVDKASPAAKKEASELYTAAMKAFDEDSYDKALEGFRASYQLVKSPNSHFMIARTYARLGHNVEAYLELAQVIVEAEALGSRYAATADSAREKQAEIRPRIGMLQVTLGDDVPKGSRALVGDEALPLDKLGKPLPVLPGESRVTLVTPTGARYSQLVAVPEGGQGTVVLSLPEADPNASSAPARVPYAVELGAHLAGETLVASDTTNRGAGLGVRGALNVVPHGVIGSTDNLALAAGIDWIPTSTRAHAWVPLQVQWNFWVVPRLSLFVEPGAAVTFGAETRVLPAVHAGARFQVYKKLYVVGRVGIPDATLGVSLLQ